MRQVLVIVATAALLASCTAPTPRSASVPAPAPAPPKSQAAACVDLAQISEARVIDDRTIDFALRDGRTLRNILPNQCPSLGAEKAFTYSTSLTRLCPTDVITVVHQSGVRAGANCGLGAFTAAPVSTIAAQ